MEQENTDQLDEIINAIGAIGTLDFSHRVAVRGENPDLDAISTAVNMLNEELRFKKVEFKERDQLIREVHHRLKNNMQIVSSLIRLQVEHNDGFYGEKELRECLNRINAMALVHESLYNSDQLDVLELNNYVSSLLKHLGDLQSEQNARVQFKGLGFGLHMDSQRSILIGLIIHELVNNAFKHSDENASVQLELSINDGNLKMIVADGGVGFASDSEFYDSEGFGLQLVHAFTEQIDGTIRLEKTGNTGSVISLELPVQS